MKKGENIGSILYHGWTFALKNWKTWVLLLLTNILFSRILISPLTNLINSVAEHRITPSKVSLTYLYDLTQQNPQFMNSVFGTVPIVFGVYLLWTIFSTGGIVQQVKYQDTKLSTFFSGGLQYFFRYLRLTIYTIVMIGGLGVFVFSLFNLGDTNIFVIESEDLFIRRFIWLSILFSLIYTFIKLWNDWLKLKIANENPKFFFRHAISSWMQIFNLRILMVFITNILCALILILALRLMTTNLNNLIFIGTQLMIVVRLLYKIANLTSLRNLMML